MSVFALIDSQVAAFRRVSFAVVASGGAVVMAAVRGFPRGPAAAAIFQSRISSAWPLTRR